MPSGGYAQFSLAALRHWSAPTKYRVLLDAASSTGTGADVHAHLHYLLAHYNWRALVHWLSSSSNNNDKCMPKEGESEVLAALDRLSALPRVNESFIARLAEEVLATRGALLPSERTDAQKIMLRAAVSISPVNKSPL